WPMKQPQAKAFQTKKQKEKFINECDAWINLACIPTSFLLLVRKFGGDPGPSFSEWMDGGSLADVIRNGSLYRGTRREQQTRLLDIAIQFARGLHYAHEQKLIHRDVKPDNVLLTKNGEVKVADFGIAKARAESMITEGDIPPGDVSSGGTLIAAKGGYTPEYCSLEQQSGKELTRRTDIYSWAVSVMEMYLGGRQWENGVIAGAACETYFPDSKVAIPEEMKTLLKACLNADEALRPHDFAVMEKALYEIYESETGSIYSRPAPKAAADTAGSLNNRALSLLDLGKPGEAEKCWEKAIGADPNHAGAVYNYGLHLWRNGKIDDEEAVTRLENIIRNTDSPTAVFCLAHLHLERGDFSMARQLLEQIPDTGALQLLSNVKEDGVEDVAFTGHSAVFTPDNNYILSAGGRGEENNVILRDAQTGRQLASFQGHTAPVNCVALSPNGLYGLSGSRDGTATLWDLKTGKCLRVLEDQKNYIHSVCFTDDGKQFLTGSNKLILWDTETFQMVRSYYEDFRGIHSIRISADGQQILSGSGGGKVYVHSLADRKVIREIQAAPSCWVIKAACYAGDSLHVLTGAGDQNTVNKMNLWHIDIPEPLHTFCGHKSNIRSVCTNSYGSYALSGGVDHAVKLWDIKNRRCLRTFSGHINEVVHVGFSTDDQYAVSSSTDNMTRLWRVPSFDVRADWLLCRISTTDEILKIEKWISALLTEVRRLFHEKDIAGAIQTLRRMEDIPGASAAAGYAELNNQIRKYCQTIDLHSCRTAYILNGHKQSVRAAAISADGLHAVSASDDNTVRIWSLRTAECLHICTEHSNWARAVCISPDGQWALSGGCDSKLVLWDIASGKKLKNLEGHNGFVEAVAFDPACRYALSGASDKTIKVWDIRSGKSLRTLTGHEKDITAVCVSPDGKTTLSCSKDGTIRLWELEKGTNLHTYNVGSPVWSVCFSPDGRTFLSGGSTGDTTLRLWDVYTGESIRSFSGHLDIFSGDRNTVNAVCFTPDGRFAVSASRELTLKLWDVRNGQCIRTLEGHGKGIYTAAFSHDGGYLISGAADTTGRIWQLDWEYMFPGWADWDEEARIYLEIFLTLHPDYNESDFKNLITDLQNRGYGWLRPGGVRARLEELKPKKKKGLFGWKKK
ncbi:protein kinase domain-containing protein, partial [Syntrophaceticus schinkii]